MAKQSLRALNPLASMSSASAAGRISASSGQVSGPCRIAKIRKETTSSRVPVLITRVTVEKVVAAANIVTRKVKIGESFIQAPLDNICLMAPIITGNDVITSSTITQKKPSLVKNSQLVGKLVMGASLHNVKDLLLPLDQKQGDNSKNNFKQVPSIKKASLVSTRDEIYVTDTAQYNNLIVQGLETTYPDTESDTKIPFKNRSTTLSATQELEAIGSNTESDAKILLDRTQALSTVSSKLKRKISDFDETLSRSPCKRICNHGYLATFNQSSMLSIPIMNKLSNKISTNSVTAPDSMLDSSSMDKLSSPILKNSLRSPATMPYSASIDKSFESPKQKPMASPKSPSDSVTKSPGGDSTKVSAAKKGGSSDKNTRRRRISNRLIVPPPTTKISTPTKSTPTKKTVTKFKESPYTSTSSSRSPSTLKFSHSLRRQSADSYLCDSQAKILTGPADQYFLDDNNQIMDPTPISPCIKRDSDQVKIIVPRSINSYPSRIGQSGVIHAGPEAGLTGIGNMTPGSERSTESFHYRRISGPLNRGATMDFTNGPLSTIELESVDQNSRGKPNHTSRRITIPSTPSRPPHQPQGHLSTTINTIRRRSSFDLELLLTPDYYLDSDRTLYSFIR